MEFNRKLRVLRVKRDMSQAQLAAALGISKSSISMYELGKRQPDFETLRSIAVFFSVDMNYLLGGERGVEMEFKDALKQLRTKRGLSQVELAEKLGFSAGLIGMYESGKRKPSFEALEAIADFFNISIDYLMGKDDKSVYYLDPEAAEIAHEVQARPELKILFDASRKVSADDLNFVIGMIDRMKKDEGK